MRRPFETIAQMPSRASFNATSALKKLTLSVFMKFWMTERQG